MLYELVSPSPPSRRTLSVDDKKFARRAPSTLYYNDNDYNITMTIIIITIIIYYNFKLVIIVTRASCTWCVHIVSILYNTSIYRIYKCAYGVCKRVSPEQ